MGRRNRPGSGPWSQPSVLSPKSRGSPAHIRSGSGGQDGGERQGCFQKINLQSMLFAIYNQGIRCYNTICSRGTAPRSRKARGISTVGSTLHWQCRGQEFESPMLHQQRKIRTCWVRVFSFRFHRSGLAVSRMNRPILLSMIYSLTGGIGRENRG